MQESAVGVYKGRLLALLLLHEEHSIPEHYADVIMDKLWNSIAPPQIAIINSPWPNNSRLLPAIVLDGAGNSPYHFMVAIRGGVLLDLWNAINKSREDVEIKRRRFEKALYPFMFEFTEDPDLYIARMEAQVITETEKSEAFNQKKLKRIFK